MLRSLLFFVLLCSLTAQAQKPEWKINLDYFFDNREYDRSEYSIAQTLSGTHIMPQMLLKIDSSRHIQFGVDVLTLAGDKKLFANIQAIAFYNLQFKQHRFVIGAFPRKNVLGHYSELMFQDSIQHFRPLMHGAFWNMGNAENYVNLWLDWTGRASTDTEESFFVGLSGAKQIFSNLSFEFQSYMFHLAFANPRTPDTFVCDNLQSIANLTYRNSIFDNKWNLQLKAGLMAGAERERNAEKIIYPATAGIFEINIQNNRFEFVSLWHMGDKRMQHYPKYGTKLYWGNPFLRGGNYIKNSLYWHVFKRNNMLADIGMHMHISNKQVYFQQTLKVSY
jgi:hypothetical protein